MEAAHRLDVAAEDIGLRVEDGRERRLFDSEGVWRQDLYESPRQLRWSARIVAA